MHAVAVEGDRQALAGAALGEPRLQVVGVEHGGLGGLGEAVGAEAEDVGVGADEDAEVALEAAQAADRLRPLEVEVVGRAAAVVALAADHLRARQEGLDPLGDGDRARPRAAAAVRLAEGLVQVDVDDVEAHVAGPRVAHDGVEVGAVVVEGAARLVDQPGDLGDVLVEDAERVRVGQHQAGDVVVDLRPQVVHLDPAALVGGDLDDLVAGHRHRGRVGAVRGVGGEDLVAGLAAVGVVGAGEEQAGELAVRAGRGLQADVGQPADLAEARLQQPHQLQRALRAPRVLGRVQPGVAGQRRDPLVEPRVVLHRAGAERVEAGVEVEVAPREPVVVADDLRLGDLGQARRLGAQQLRGDQLLERRLRDFGVGQDGRPAARLRLLEDRSTVTCSVLLVH